MHNIDCGSSSSTILILTHKDSEILTDFVSFMKSYLEFLSFFLSNVLNFALTFKFFGLSPEKLHRRQIIAQFEVNNGDKLLLDAAHTGEDLKILGFSLTGSKVRDIRDRLSFKLSANMEQKNVDHMLVLQLYNTKIQKQEVKYFS
jgi:hypothetical protein